MRNLLFVATAILLALAFTSCEKDGQYKPKERISKVYRSYSSEKRLACTWTWNDDKLSRIDYYTPNGEQIWSENFYYDNKNRIEKVEVPETNEIVEYKYEGNKLAGLSYYCEEDLVQTASISYGKGKMSKMDMIVYDTRYPEKSRLSLIPKEIKNAISPKNSNIDYAVTVELTWDGDNISQNKITSTTSGTGAGFNGDYYTYEYSRTATVEYNYTYDNKINPLKGLWNLNSMIDEEYVISVHLFSKNNMTSSTYTFTETETNITTGETETDSYTHGINYSIAYDGKYPTEIMETEQGDSFTITTYYEYE